MKYESDESAMSEESKREIAQDTPEPTDGLEPTSEDLKDQIKALTRAVKRRDDLLDDLRQTLIEVKQLKGILPICASCKKIRDYDGYWCQIESYIGSHADVEFSHGVCPDCMTALYPDVGRKPHVCDPEGAENIPR